MNDSSLLIVPRDSRLEWQMQQHRQTEMQALRDLEKQGFDAELIARSHAHQQAVIQQARRLWPEATWCRRAEFDRIPSGVLAVMALGGDGHLMFVARRVTTQLLIGVNADPETSVGATLPFTAADLPIIAQQLRNDSFVEERRTRLHVILNGKPLPQVALSEIYAGQSQSLLMSQSILRIDDQEERQKHAGIVIATGTGASGWAHGIMRHWPSPLRQQLPQATTEPVATVLVRDLYMGKMDIHQVNADSVVTITSLNSQGILALDADSSDPQAVFPFPSGSIATIAIATQLSLRIMKSADNH